MRFGCCLPGASFVPQIKDAPKTDAPPALAMIDGVKAFFRAGCDFVEMNVVSLARLTDAEFAEFKGFLKESGRKIEVFCSMVPPDIRLTGEDLDVDAIKSYIELALGRCAACGADTVIFGSGGARSRPENFDYGRAMEQILDFLKLCDGYAEKFGLKICIEPINRAETNMIFTVAEGYDIWKKAALPNIRLLADSYHMSCSGEDFGVLEDAADALSHVHVSDLDRALPGKIENGFDFPRFFEKLKSAGYKGRLSVETPFGDLREDAAYCMEYLRKTWGEA